MLWKYSSWLLSSFGGGFSFYVCECFMGEMRNYAIILAPVQDHSS